MKAPIYYRRFDYDRNQLPNPVLRAAEEDVRTIEQAEEKTGATIGYPGWPLIYYILLSHLHQDRPNYVVETGTNWGMTTIVLAEAIKAAGGGALHTIEIDPDNHRRAQQNVEKAGLTDIANLHLGHSHAMLPPVLAKLPSVRVAFLDGSHEHDDVMREFELVLEKLEPTGLVIMDNTYPLTDVAAGEPARVSEALKTIKTRYGGNTINLEHVSWYTPGVAIWQPNAR